MLIVTESGLNLHEKICLNLRKETIPSPSVVVYSTAEENLSNPSETSLYFINFYDQKLNTPYHYSELNPCRV